MEAWIGPALLAAVIAGLVNVAGWYVTYARERRLESERRREKVRDYLTALRAEIRAHNFRWTKAEADEDLVAMERKLQADPRFTAFVPKEAESIIFPTIARELHILPGDVIDPVVRYQRQLASLAFIVEDLRSTGYAELAADRKLAMYADYIHLRVEAGHLAESTLDAIKASRVVE
ncbi:hypothetical protein ACFOEZ_16595 [Tianweitania populi]|uniref:Uncharacterized protein n=1 Tax=Tianweitania populi TaxID=1607949 RepID=A0A8J3DPQ5_9HYPH|nr:hypothetical protein [Tianweitania populi]GHD15196.1 hypothetical protein GCM10016234_21640 [Tianweitania populi]